VSIKVAQTMFSVEHGVGGEFCGHDFNMNSACV